MTSTREGVVTDERLILGTVSPEHPDMVCAAALDEARAAAEMDAPAGAVGAHLGILSEGERIATHLFECLQEGYRGWRWAVTVARVPRGRTVTIDEVVLLPGPDSLLAPPWVPWSDRVLPGDLGVGDVLPTPADDPRLVPGFTDADALEGVDSPSPLMPGMWEIGLGRVRVLSDIGRLDAADRWHEVRGPESPLAKSAPAPCLSCGFLLPLGGPMGQAFGVCANEMSPVDGCVVALDHGCGAHSEIATVLGLEPEISASI
jgi:hypothetical protein